MSAPLKLSDLIRDPVSRGPTMEQMAQDSARRLVPATPAPPQPLPVVLLVGVALGAALYVLVGARGGGSQSWR